MAKVKIPTIINNRQWNYDYSSNNLTDENLNEILQDEQVQSNLNTLVAGIGAAETTFNSESVTETVDSYIKSMFDETSENYFDWILFKEQMFTMLSRRNSVIRFIWNDAKDKIKRFINLKNNQFTFNEDLELIDSNNSLMMPNESYKYLYHVFINKQDGYNKLGKTIFNKNILNLVRIKKMLNPKMYDAIDASISEPIIAIIKETTQDDYDMNDTTSKAEFEASIETVSDNLRDIRSGGSMASTAIEDIKTVKTKPDANLFEKFFSIINSVISVAILGTDKTTNSQERGSYASDKVGQDVQVLITKEYSRIFNQARNEVIRKSIDVKFGTDQNATTVSFNYPDSYSIEQLTNMHVAGIATRKDKWGDVLPDDTTEESNILTPTQSVLEFAEKKKPLQKPKLTF